MANTYACRNATRNSKPISATFSANGATAATNPIVPAPASITTKVAKTFSITCPATMLANRRIDRLTGRDRYEITSTGIINGANSFGAPAGKK